MVLDRDPMTSFCEEIDEARLEADVVEVSEAVDVRLGRLVPIGGLKWLFPAAKRREEGLG